jgi:hypothetical protein
MKDLAKRTMSPAKRFHFVSASFGLRAKREFHSGQAGRELRIFGKPAIIEKSLEKKFGPEPPALG